jgi:hypothetical protein
VQLEPHCVATVSVCQNGPSLALGSLLVLYVAGPRMANWTHDATRCSHRLSRETTSEHAPPACVWNPQSFVVAGRPYG